MALEAVVFQQDPFSYGFKDLGETSDPWSCGFGLEEEAAHSEILLQNGGLGLMTQKMAKTNSSTCGGGGDGFFTGESRPLEVPLACHRRKRRRTRSVKNIEEVESQRMTHIFVERNRRKQMKNYLSVLRSLMPPSYVQRGDQASIVGGAINYVKELEQLVQTLEAHKRIHILQQSDDHDHDDAGFSTSIFSNFFSFPQYSDFRPNDSRESSSTAPKKPSGPVADIEVTMAESNANIKILSTRYPKQLFKMVTGFHSLGLHVLHLNVATFDNQVLYTFSVKVEEGCHLRSMNEIAAAVYDMMGRVQGEAAFK